MKTSRQRRKVLGDQHDVVQFVIKVPKPLLEAVAVSAAANYESVPTFVRRVLVERLRADGVLPPVQVKPTIEEG